MFGAQDCANTKNHLRRTIRLFWGCGTGRGQLDQATSRIIGHRSLRHGIASALHGSACVKRPFPNWLKEWGLKHQEVLQLGTVDRMQRDVAVACHQASAMFRRQG